LVFEDVESKSLILGEIIVLFNKIYNIAFLYLAGSGGSSMKHLTAEVSLIEKTVC
jgi:hypothetical protein